MAKGQRFTEEDKLNAVRRMANGESARDVASDIGVHYTTLSDWKAKYKGQTKKKMTRAKPKPKTEAPVAFADGLVYWKGSVYKKVADV